MINVFLSSTARDLSECREAADRAIEGLQGYHSVRMEDFGSWDVAPDEFCRSKVAECDLFVCIAGPLYGSLTPAGPSYTEREYDAAIEHHKPCLAFLTADDFLLPANQVEPDKNRKRQLAFRKKLCKGRTVTRFSTCKDVAVRVVQALRNWEVSMAPTGAPSQSKLLSSQISSVSYRVALLNRSTSMTDIELQSAVSALQTQVHRDFAPIWGIDADLTFVPNPSKPPSASWWLVFLDTSDQAGALGYRDLTPEGLPMAKVFVKSALETNNAWTVTASHVLLEMLANPRLNLTVFVQTAQKKGTLYPHEVCNPCGADRLGYRIGGTLVSDFVFPAWFENFRKRGSTQFDYCKHISRPFEILSGGYATVCEVSSDVGWRSLFGSVSPSRKKPSAHRQKS